VSECRFLLQLRESTTTASGKQQKGTPRAILEAIQTKTIDNYPAKRELGKSSTAVLEVGDLERPHAVGVEDMIYTGLLGQTQFTYRLPVLG
jgi:hypothetical protein